MDIQKRLKLLKPLVTFNKNEFIFIQILVRRKDNPELDLSVKRLKSYSFYSWEELESQIDRIKEICDMNNARAYIRLNKQNSVDVSLRCISEMSDNLRTGNSSKNKGVWDSVAGKLGSKDWWVLDLDSEHIDLKDDLIQTLIYSYNNRNGEFDYYWITNYNFDMLNFLRKDTLCMNNYPIYENQTKSGIHIICKPFDTRILDKYNRELSSKGIPTIQIQRDANTVLYIGNK